MFKMNQSTETDVVIVGAGLVGLSAAVAFAKQGRQVTLVDSKPIMHQKSAEWDARIYAISLESETWLKDLGVWSFVDAARVCPIDAMHLWHASDTLILNSSDANVPKLGVMMESQNLMFALWQQVNALQVTVIAEVNGIALNNEPEKVCLLLDNQQQIQAKLLIAADGTQSWVRQQAAIGVQTKDFNQTAIVANFETELPHLNVAMQWFAPHETLALLPLVGKNTSLVWSVSTERAQALLNLSSDDFVAELEAYSQQKLGHLKLLGSMHSFKLCQQTAREVTTNRVVLVGDAAHQVHPMAGQGVNLGFRDVMELSYQATKLHALQDLGDAAQLRHYARSRKADILTMNTLTSGLDDWFAREAGLAKKLTHWGMRQLNQSSMLKKQLIQQLAA